MDKKVAKDLKGKADGVLLLLFLLDIAIAATIITSPHQSVGWLIFWWVALSITTLMSFTSLVVFSAKSVGGHVEDFEGIVVLVSWILRTVWFARGSFLVLLAASDMTLFAVASAGFLTALYLSILLLCFSATPGSEGG